MFKIREIHKAVNIAVIFMILVCWVGQEFAYSSDIFYLRVPMGIGKNRAAALARAGGAKRLPAQGSTGIKDQAQGAGKIERAGGDKAAEGDRIVSLREPQETAPLRLKLKISDETEDIYLKSGYRGFFTPYSVDIPAQDTEKVQRLFFTVQQFISETHMNPRWGFYGGGKFSSIEFTTTPRLMSPLFGAMVCEHLFKIWEGMRKAGSLEGHYISQGDNGVWDGDLFYIYELGAGDGTLAFDILNHAQQKSTQGGGIWKEFYSSLQYQVVDVSRIQSQKAIEKNREFIEQHKLVVHQTSSEEFLNSMSSHPHIGVVLSNEFFDDIPAHQVRFKRNGQVEVAILMPTTDRDTLELLQEEGIINIQKLQLVELQDHPGILLIPRDAFLAIKDELETPEGSELKEKLKGKFWLTAGYIDAKFVPEVIDYLTINRREIALGLARSKSDIVAMINPQHKEVLQKMAKILSRGYLFTLDYAHSTSEILDPRACLMTINHSPLKEIDPVLGIGDYNIDFIPDATYLMKVGETHAIRTVFYGAQNSLQDGTNIEILTPEAQDILLRSFLSSHTSLVRETTMAQFIPPEKRNNAPYDVLYLFYEEFFKGLPLTIYHQQMPQYIQALLERYPILKFLQDSIYDTARSIEEKAVLARSERIKNFNDPHFRLLIQQLPNTDNQYVYHASKDNQKALLSSEFKMDSTILAQADKIEQVLIAGYSPHQITELKSKTSLNASSRNSL